MDLTRVVAEKSSSCVIDKSVAIQDNLQSLYDKGIDIKEGIDYIELTKKSMSNTPTPLKLVRIAADML